MATEGRDASRPDLVLAPAAVEDSASTPEAVGVPAELPEAVVASAAQTVDAAAAKAEVRRRHSLAA